MTTLTMRMTMGRPGPPACEGATRDPCASLGLGFFARQSSGGAGRLVTEYVDITWFTLRFEIQTTEYGFSGY